MRAILAALALTALAASAAAQEAEDAWSVVERDDGVITASVAYASGPAIAVRCLPGNALQVILAGLPAAEDGAFTRSLDVTQPNGNVGPSNWVVASDRTSAFAMAPSRTARTFRTAGRFTVRAPTAEGRHRRLELDLPQNTAGMDRVLEACDRDLNDPTDLDTSPPSEAGTTPTVDWAARPRPNYPRRAEANHVTRGIAALDCGVLESGRLEGCRIEAEFPYGMGFGPESLVASWEARLTRESAIATKGRARFTINFRLE